MLTRREEFDRLAEVALRRIEDWLEERDAEYEVLPGGVLEVELADDTKMVINRHSVAQEIWMAAHYEGHHFRYHPENELWMDTKSGEELIAVLARFLN